MSIPEPEPPRDARPPAGWYQTGEAGPDGQPFERWWDGAQWSATIRPLGVGASAPGRRNRARTAIAAGVIVALAGGGIGAYFALHNSTPAAAASAGPQPTATSGPGNGNDNGNGGNGGGTGGGLGGGLGGATAAPAPTITGGGGKTVSDPIDGLTIPVPGGWTAVAGSLSGQGSWPALSTGQYTCPSALSQANGSSSATTCDRAGINFTVVSGSGAQSVATSDVAALAKNNYGTLSSHSVVSQGAVTVAGRAGYQITWSVVPSYSGPSGTVEVIAVPMPGHSGDFTLIDIGVDQSSQAPSLSSVDTQIISNITDSNASGT